MYFLQGRHNLHLDYAQGWIRRSQTLFLCWSRHIRNESRGWAIKALAYRLISFPQFRLWMSLLGKWVKLAEESPRRRRHSSTIHLDQALWHVVTGTHGHQTHTHTHTTRKHTHTRTQRQHPIWCVWEMEDEIKQHGVIIRDNHQPHTHTHTLFILVYLLTPVFSLLFCGPPALHHILSFHLSSS